MVIDIFKEQDGMEWDAFILASDEGTLFHMTGWKTLLERFGGYRSCYLKAVENGRIVGVLPLFIVTHRLFGKKMISVPYAVRGSLCTGSDEAAGQLLEQAVIMAKKEQVDFLELRDVRERPGPFQTDSRYATFQLNLGGGPESILKAMRKSHRRTLKKAQENGLELDLEYGDIEAFYRFYARDQHRFGTPVQGYGWIRGLFDQFPEYHSLARVLFHGETIAVFMVRRFKGVVSEVIGNDVPAYRHLFPNQFLEWGLIQDGCDRGCHAYDFGRSLADSGSCQFKLGWGAEPQPFYYHYFLNRVKTVPDTSQTGSDRRRFARVWRAVPLPVANRLGPMIRQRFP